jgi:hypothetical protein
MIVIKVDGRTQDEMMLRMISFADVEGRFNQSAKLILTVPAF